MGLKVKHLQEPKRLKVSNNALNGNNGVTQDTAQLDHRTSQKRTFFKLTAVDGKTNFDFHTDPSEYPSRRLRPGEIRLMQLHPGNLGEALSCRLDIFQLDVHSADVGLTEGSVGKDWTEAGAFEALSYTWGPSLERRKIRVNGKHDLPITDNLWYALQRLRYQPKAGIRTLWIDAIAIDQHSGTEKAQQVANMVNVYKSARRVVVWLDTGDGVGNEGILRRLEIILKQRPRSMYITLPKALLALQAAFSATQDLWFERTWVVQEFLVAQSVQFVFGQFCMNEMDPGEGFESAFVKLMKQMSISSGSAAALDRSLRAMYDFRPRHISTCFSRGAPQIDDFDILMRSQRLPGLKLTDPRDRVYGMLGLLPQQQADGIVVDYSRTCAQVYAQATYANILYQGNFDMLGQIRMNRSRPRALRSWAFDFGDPDYERIDGISIGRTRNSEVTAKSIDLDVFWRRLTVRGQRFGKLAARQRQSGKWTFVSDGEAEVIIRDVEKYMEHVVIATRGGRCWNLDPRAKVSSEDQSTVRRETFGELSRRIIQRFRSVVSHYPVACGPYKYAGRAAAGGDVDFFVLDNGLFGFGPDMLGKRHSVVLLRGSQLPVVLRPCTDGTWLFRGFVYVHGVLPFRQSQGDGAAYQGFVDPDCWRDGEADEDFVLS